MTSTIRVNSLSFSGSVADGPGVRSILFLQGCDVHCPGCHSPSTWDPSGGLEMDIEDLFIEIKTHCTNKKLTISGGEPLFQKEALTQLVNKLDGFDLCLYTSHDMKDVPASILKRLSYIKTGPFVQTQRTTTLPFRGSTNQQFISLTKKTLQIGPSYVCARRTEMDNASRRETYVGKVYTIGSDASKADALKKLPEEWSRLHTDGHIHIHDLDAYDFAYNCLAFNLSQFPFEFMKQYSTSGRIFATFNYFKDIISKVGNEQSGGMSFANFDVQLGEIFEKLEVPLTQTHTLLLEDAIREFINWCSNNHERRGMDCEYVSLNIGLASTEWARLTCGDVLKAFTESPPDTIMPNIIFKVKNGINQQPSDRNYGFYQQALRCTARKMIPTYLLCDCESNKDVDPMKLAIMGCRTRIVQDIFGCEGAEGRGNIANITINLPRIAFEVTSSHSHTTHTRNNTSSDTDEEEKVRAFTSLWDHYATIVADILLHRYRLMASLPPSSFPTVSASSLWCEPFSTAPSSSSSVSSSSSSSSPSSPSSSPTVENVFRHGTLSIGFIGLNEAF